MKQPQGHAKQREIFGELSLIESRKNEACQKKYEQAVKQMNDQVHDTKWARVSWPGLAIESETGKAQRTPQGARLRAQYKLKIIVR